MENVEQKTNVTSEDCWVSKDLIDFNEPGILWELDRDKYNNILHSPVCSEIYHEDGFPFGAAEFEKKFGKQFNKNIHENFVSKVTGFLEKTGSVLITGFRGVGKSSVINRAIYEYIIKRKKLDESKELHEMECPILISIPLEHSIEKHSLIKMIFDLVSSHEKVKQIVVNKCQEAISSNKIRQNFTLAISSGSFLFILTMLLKFVLWIFDKIKLIKDETSFLQDLGFGATKIYFPFYHEIEIPSIYRLTTFFFVLLSLQRHLSC
jgi:hypothetical protein